MSGSSNSSTTIRLERTRRTGLFYCNFFKSIRSGGGSQSWLSLPLIRTVNSLVPHLSQRYHLWTNDQFVDGNSDRPVTLALLDTINRVPFFYVGSQDGELPSRPLPRYGLGLCSRFDSRVSGISDRTCNIGLCLSTFPFLPGLNTAFS